MSTDSQLPVLQGKRPRKPKKATVGKQRLPVRIVEIGSAAPEQLMPHPLNWRKHPQFQRDSLKAILQRIGWVQNVVVNRRTGRLIDGHLRVALAMEMQEPQVPVLYVDLSEEEEKVVLASLDPIGDYSTADLAVLTRLYESIAQGNEVLRDVTADDDLLEFLQHEADTSINKTRGLGDHITITTGEPGEAEPVRPPDETAEHKAQACAGLNGICPWYVAVDVNVGKCPCQCVYCYVDVIRRRNCYYSRAYPSSESMLRKAVTLAARTSQIVLTTNNMEPTATPDSMGTLLRLAAEADVAVKVNTKKPNLLLQIAQQVGFPMQKLFVCVSITCLQPPSDMWEPYAEPPEERIKGIGRLVEAGGSAIFFFSPAIPHPFFVEQIEQLTQKTAAAGAERMLICPLRIYATSPASWMRKLQDALRPAIPDLRQWLDQACYPTGSPFRIVAGSYCFNNDWLRQELLIPARDTAHRHGMQFSILDDPYGIGNLDLQDGPFCCSCKKMLQCTKPDRDSIIMRYFDNRLKELAYAPLRQALSREERNTVLAQLLFANDTSTYQRYSPAVQRAFGW